MGDPQPDNHADSEACWRAALATGQPEFLTASWYTTPLTFAIDQRVIDQHICNLIVEGSVAVSVAGQRQVLGPGSVVWLSPGVCHSMHLAVPGQAFAMLNTRWRLWHNGTAVAMPRPYLMARERWDLRSWFETVIDDRLRRHPERARRACSIWYLLYSDLAQADEAECSGGLDRRRCQALMAWVQRHVADDPTPADLAAVVGLTPDYFRRVFQRTYGQSPRTWIADERMRIAGQRLLDEPTAAIGEIAQQVGWADQAGFARQFRRSMGLSPRAWRQRG